MDILKITRPDRNWYEIIIWWEVRRIPYNFLMYFVGIASFYISFITIPLVYLLVGLGLNLIYTFGWIIELIFRHKMSENLKMKFSNIVYIIYLLISTCIIFGIALSLLFQFY